MRRVQTKSITKYESDLDGLIFMRGLKTKCIIGIFDWERKKKQTILVDFKFPSDISKAAKSDRIEDTEDYKSIAKLVLKFTAESTFFLIETLSEKIAEVILKHIRSEWVQVTVSKPGAVRFSENVGIQITRYRKDIEHQKTIRTVAYLSIGSNIKRRHSIEQALILLKETFGTVTRSSIYESSAIGNDESPNFWNLMVKIETRLSPAKLKLKLLQIEKKIGRTKSQNKFEPRVIDIDIVFYGSKIIKQNKLCVPHLDSAHAHYMLIPMVQLDANFIHPKTKKTILEMLGFSLDKKRLFTRIDW